MPKPAKIWLCRFCGITFVQEGPHALEMLPTPPHGWVHIQRTEILPPTTVMTGPGEKVKMGESRSSRQFSLCPKCAPGFDTAYPSA